MVIICTELLLNDLAKKNFCVTRVVELQFPALRDFVSSGKPVWGTCAGLIFLADKAIGELLC